jgi:thiol-disulfide isomerase/thioredoxin
VSTTFSARTRRVLVWLTVLVFAQIGAYFGYRAVEHRRGAQRPAAFEYETLVAEPRALDAAVQTRDRRPTTLRGQRGKPVLLHFWATWCEPCRAELPTLMALSREQRVTVLLISVDESWPVIEHYFDADVPAEIMLDHSRELRRAFGVSTLPDSYLLDDEGRPVARFQGARDWASEEARRAIAALLPSL